MTNAEAALSFRTFVRTAWFPATVAIIASTVWSFIPGHLSFPAIIILDVSVFAWCVTGGVKLMRDLIRRRWRNSAARMLRMTAAVPLIVLGIAAGDYVHLAAFYPRYHSVFGGKPDYPVRFAWGDEAVSALDGIRLRTLIYDRIGETRAEVGKTFKQDGFRVSTSHLIGSYFLQTSSAP